MSQLLSVALLASACQTPAYVIDGASRRQAQPTLVGMEHDTQVLIEARAAAEPVIRVVPERALGHRVREVTVTYHGPDSEPGLVRLMAEMEGGHVSIVYAPPGGHRLPVAVGDQIRIRHLPPDPESVFQGDALIVRDTSDTILAAYSAGGGLPGDLFGGRLSFGPSPRLAYTEVVSLDSMCLAMLEHRRLRVQYDGTFHHMAPGTTVTLPFGGRTYRLVVLDVVQPVPGRCAGEAASKLSFAIIALPEA
jgi:hypothetical protein